MKGKKTDLTELRKKIETHRRVFSSRTEERNPELIEKFYKQIINGFGYAYPAKV